MVERLLKILIGGTSIIDQSVLTAGIGRTKGAGGSRYWNNENKEVVSQAAGGCLYILSADIYNICTIELSDFPDDIDSATVNIEVTNDAFPGGDESNASPSVGTITKTITKEDTHSLSFIVKKGATVKYNIVSDDDNYLVEGKAENIGTTTATSGAYDSNTNIHKITTQLHKRILTHTIINKTNGNLKITGQFTDDQGNVIDEIYTVNGQQEIKVWSKHPTVNYTVSKTYYDIAESGKSSTLYGTLNPITITKDNNGGSTPISIQLQKKKYYATLKTGTTTYNKGDTVTLEYGNSQQITASWNWTSDEKNNSTGTKWQIIESDFKMNHNTGSTITYGETKYSNNLPNNRTVTFYSNYKLVIKYKTKFTFGTIYAILDN